MSKDAQLPPEHAKAALDALNQAWAYYTPQPSVVALRHKPEEPIVPYYDAA